ncbi:hypothetical protein Riv7116_6573 [Rivularia sp. PCC 7116]|uniref:hypothetical protein n=1 Tax=Rivularia sp. PCC 7116 TaxID=373994 RepID=UPI00029F0B2D|nr:hypothetical protein [Rivularia sp. PCC 7116]AFY58900.1 hypothetical protein Riv7116_6573 [Rivularia sp. PCC 7116]
MNWKLLIINFSFFCFIPLTAQACPSGNSKSHAYIRRENNRCEGLISPNVSPGSVDLISFSTGELSNRYPSKLHLRVPMKGVPMKGKKYPELRLESYYRRYLLDKITLKRDTNGFNFPLKTTILQKAGIPSRSLRALSHINRNGNIIYFPVVLGRISDKYQFVVKNPHRRSFSKIQIRYKGKPVFNTSRKIPRKQIKISWKYGKARPGIYELYLEDSKNKSVPHKFRFQHNPHLL